MSVQISPTINTFADLLYIVNTNAEWRRQMVSALFPDVDIQKTLEKINETNRLLREDIALMRRRLDKVDSRLDNVEKDVAEIKQNQQEMKADISDLKQNQQEMKADISDLKQNQQEMKADISDLKQNQQAMKADISDLKQNQQEMKADISDLKQNQQAMKADISDLKQNQQEMKADIGNLQSSMKEVRLELGDLHSSVGELKGDNYENQFVNKINPILSRVLRRGRDARNELSDHLDEAEEAGIISEKESSDVLSADLLWQGIDKRSRKSVYLIGEASWLVEPHDVERALVRAQIVKQAGFEAISVVAGKKWTQEALEAASTQNTARIRNYSLEQDSWPLIAA